MAYVLGNSCKCNLTKPLLKRFNGKWIVLVNVFFCHTQSANYLLAKAWAMEANREARIQKALEANEKKYTAQLIANNALFEKDLAKWNERMWRQTNPNINVK